MRLHDPLLAYNFRVNLLDSTTSPASAVTSVALTPLVINPLAGFSECTGLEMTLETEDYKEGGNNGTVLKFPKRAKCGEITLRKGRSRRTELFDWYYGFTQGVGQTQGWADHLMNEKHKPHTVWRFRRGLPVKYVGPAVECPTEQRGDRGDHNRARGDLPHGRRGRARRGGRRGRRRHRRPILAMQVIIDEVREPSQSH